MSAFDIIFISYKETNADLNWSHLKKRFPLAHRVHGIKGIYEAHKKAAEMSRTQYFFVVDGDNRINDDFDFSVEGLKLNDNSVYVWRCYNPICEMIYGYGAVKLYNKSLFRKTVNGYGDLATTIGAVYSIVDQIASSTYFFESPKEAWRGSFREAAKLSSQMIHGQKTKETQERLVQWQNIDPTKPNALWCLEGVKMGIEFGEQIKKHPSLRSQINDYDWLDKEFDRIKVKVGSGGLR